MEERSQGDVMGEFVTDVMRVWWRGETEGKDDDP